MNEIPDYVIAIRSHKRSDTIKNKTLRVLKESGIPDDRIYIFVGENEKQTYRESLGDTYNIINGGDTGVDLCNRLIIDYFPENQYIIQCDDDINFVLKLKDKEDSEKGVRQIINGRVEPQGLKSTNVLDLIIYGKNLMDKYLLNIWGLYPVVNSYFMKDDITLDLRFLIGRIFGFNNTKDVITTDSCRDDYERSILYYIRDGGIIRLNNYVADADTYIGKGGLAEERTIKMMSDSAISMINKYPEYVCYKTCKSIYDEIRLIIQS